MTVIFCKWQMILQFGCTIFHVLVYVYAFIFMALFKCMNFLNDFMNKNVHNIYRNAQYISTPVIN